jgi:tetraacyldisaccharide-1-P 4'-kinase
LASMDLLAQASQRQRLGLFTAIARPERLHAALQRSGVTLACTVRASDHRPESALAQVHALSASVDGWILTEKCVLGLGGTERAQILFMRARETSPQKPLWVIRKTVVLSEPLKQQLHDVFRS